MTTFAPVDEETGIPKCPACKRSMERTPRTLFMRFLIGSKRYYCWSCHREYLYFLRSFFS